MAFLSQATSSWRLASSSRLPFRSMLLTLRGGPESLAPRAHQIPVSPMVFSTFLCRAFTAHEAVMVDGRWLMRDGIVRTMDEGAIVREADRIGRAAWRRLF